MWWCPQNMKQLPCKRHLSKSSENSFQKFGQLGFQQTGKNLARAAGYRVGLVKQSINCLQPQFPHVSQLAGSKGLQKSKLWHVWDLALVFLISGSEPRARTKQTQHFRDAVCSLASPACVTLQVTLKCRLSSLSQHINSLSNRRGEKKVLKKDKPDFINVSQTIYKDVFLWLHSLVISGNSQGAGGGYPFPYLM